MRTTRPHLPRYLLLDRQAGGSPLQFISIWTGRWRLKKTGSALWAQADMGFFWKACADPPRPSGPTQADQERARGPHGRRLSLKSRCLVCLGKGTPKTWPSCPEFQRHKSEDPAPVRSAEAEEDTRSASRASRTGGDQLQDRRRSCRAQHRALRTAMASECHPTSPSLTITKRTSLYPGESWQTPPQPRGPATGQRNVTHASRCRAGSAHHRQSHFGPKTD